MLETASLTIDLKKARITLEFLAGRVEECKKSGAHLGYQMKMGPASGKYNPRDTYQCSHCELIYEAFTSNGRPIMPEA